MTQAGTVAVRRVLVALIAMWGAACSEVSQQVAMQCRWVLYGTENDSFIFDLGVDSVYWVNEDSRYPITELNEGRMGFTGVRSEVRVSDAEVLREIALTFSVNRISGELYISGIDLPSGYDNYCVVSDPVF